MIGRSVLLKLCVLSLVFRWVLSLWCVCVLLNSSVVMFCGSLVWIFIVFFWVLIVRFWVWCWVFDLLLGEIVLVFDIEEFCGCWWCVVCVCGLFFWVVLICCGRLFWWVLYCFVLIWLFKVMDLRFCCLVWLFVLLFCSGLGWDF